MRRGLVPPGASSVAEPVLATLAEDELAGFVARQQAFLDAQRAMQDAELELQHYAMTLRHRHQWTAPNVKVNTTTGEVTAHNI